MIRLSPEAHLKIQENENEERFQSVIKGILDCHALKKLEKDKTHNVIAPFHYRNCGHHYAIIFKRGTNNDLLVYSVLRRARLHKILNRLLPFDV
jgi:hypothetical protein